MKKGSKMTAESRLKMSAASKQRVGEKAANWKGGMTKRHGRFYLTIRPKVRVARYRYVMEQYLGRALTSKEAVHHINGDPTDDRIENLKVMTISEHNQLHQRGMSRSTETRNKISEAKKNYWKNKARRLK